MFQEKLKLHFNAFNCSDEWKFVQSFMVYHSNSTLTKKTLQQAIRIYLLKVNHKDTKIWPYENCYSFLLLTLKRLLPTKFLMLTFFSNLDRYLPHVIVPVPILAILTQCLATV